MYSSPMALLSSPTPTRTPRSASWPSPGKHRSIFSTRRRRGSSSQRQDMNLTTPSRRTLLKSLTATAAVGSVLRVIPLQAAEYAHRLIDDEKSATAAYTPKFFDPHQYKTLQALCDTILPADADSGGAVE